MQKNKRRGFFLFLLSLSIMVMLSLLSQYISSPVYAATCQKIIIPSYFYPNPTTQWDQGINSFPTVKMMIVDPASGPGATVDSNYVTVIAQAQAKGVRPVGYITSSYATKSTAAFEAEVDLWRTMYGVYDIFVDEGTADAGHVAYYSNLNAYIKSHAADAVVIINPGIAAIDEGYITAADIIVNFEGDYTAYQTATFPSWVSKYAPSKFLHLVYGVTDTTSMQSVLTLSQSRNVGYLYITDDVLPNPWDTLPAYWSDEFFAVATTCAPTSRITPPPKSSVENRNTGRDYRYYRAPFTRTSKSANRLRRP